MTTTTEGALATMTVPAQYDHLAPDGSEIRLLPTGEKGSLAHCTLPPGGVSSPVRHSTVEEFWYFIAGTGEVWRQTADARSVVEVGPGVALTIPVATSFQFRNTGAQPLQFVITTVPAWPGAQEAVPAAGFWEPGTAAADQARSIASRPALELRMLHHVSLPVRDLDRSKRFYGETLELREVERPPFRFPGAWYQLGDRTLHLIVHDRPTFRQNPKVDSRDVHFAVRVPSFQRALAFLKAKGFRPESESTDEADPMRMKVNTQADAGFPQIFIGDPDRHVIEINAEKDDSGG